MSATTVNEMCRVTVVGRGRTVDLALPVDLVLADLLPVMLGHLEEDLGGAVSGRGIVLQRLGEPPLDGALTPQQLGLRDGDVLHARPAETPLPPADVDDLVAGVAEQVAGRSGRWSPALTRQLCRSGFVGAFLLGAVVLLRDGPQPARSLLAGAVCLLLLGAAALYSRRLAEPGTAVLLSLVAVGYGALATVLTFGSLWAGGSTAGAWDPLLALWAAAGGLATAVVARVVSTEGHATLLAVVALGCVTLLGALLVALPQLTVTDAATIVSAVALLTSPFFPGLAFRLAGLRVPDVPVTPEDVTRDVEPLTEAEVTARAAAADRYASALYVSLGVVCAVAVTPLAFAPGWAPPVFAALVCGLLLMRYRNLSSAWQRFALAVPASYGVVLLVWRLTGSLEPAALLGLVFSALVLLGLGLLLGARRRPERPVRPYWGRAAEVGETLLAADLVPVGLAVLGVYELVLGVGG